MVARHIRSARVRHDDQVIFPEINVEDRSQKLKDLALSEDRKWIMPSQAGPQAAKELRVEGYDYEEVEQFYKEKQEEDQAEFDAMNAPLTTPGTTDGPPEKKSFDSKTKGDIKKQMKNI